MQGQSTHVTVGAGSYTYWWNSHWAQIPDFVTFSQHDGTPNGRTHGVTATDDGRIVVFNQSNYGILFFHPDGTFAGTWDQFPSPRFTGAHGLRLHREDGKQYLWLTDQESREVVKTTLDGQTVLSIDRPTGGVYADKDAKYIPTWAAQADNGTIYVADGYGSHHVSRYDRDGRYIDSFAGDATSPIAGIFKCPHAVWIGRRPQATGRDGQVVYITDRSNSKVQIYGLDWNFLNSFHQGHPCDFDMGPGGELLVPDLFASVQLYDAADRPIVSLGLDPKRPGAAGWPNLPDAAYADGKFSSPHGGCFDRQGNIYIVEWRIGGRITKLTRI
jgi:hypothetical protein